MSIEATAWAETVRAPSAMAKHLLLVVCMSSGMLPESNNELDRGLGVGPNEMIRLVQKTQLSPAKIEKAFNSLVKCGLLQRFVVYDDGVVVYRVCMTHPARRAR